MLTSRKGSSNKIPNPDTLVKIYERFVEDDIIEKEYLVDKTTFRKIGEDFYGAVVENVLQNKTFELPFGLGEIHIEKKKITKYGTSAKYIDWKATLELGKVVYHLNEHSNGYNYKIKWIKPLRHHNNVMYQFIPTRYFKRDLARRIKNKEFDYFEK